MTHTTNQLVQQLESNFLSLTDGPVVSEPAHSVENWQISLFITNNIWVLLLSFIYFFSAMSD